MSHFFVLYRSKAVKTLDEKTVVDIVATSIRNNQRDGLTGFLHTEQSHFLQFLEGPRAPLMRKVAQIRKDRRHINFIILADGETDARLFPDWDMGTLPASISALMPKEWMYPSPIVDPLPLLHAFAHYAAQVETARLTALE